MRGRGLALGALVLSAACAAPAPRLHLPPSGLELAADPPPPPPPPPPAPRVVPGSRPVRLEVTVENGSRVVLDAHCRIGVWTTLRDVRTLPFTIRRAWGRLGDRPPRRLGEVRDLLVTGVVARVKPRPDGALDFLVEVSTGRVEGEWPHWRFFDVLVTRPFVARDGYLFAGDAPAGHAGTIAAWGSAVRVLLGGEGPAPEEGLRFRAKDASCFCAGSAPRAEAFHVSWNPVPESIVETEGVVRGDFRIAPERRAAGARVVGGEVEVYGGGVEAP